LFILSLTLGNVWVYSNYNKVSYDPTYTNYCDKTLYLFSFWSITVGYIIAGAVCVIGLLIFCGVCCGMCICACVKK